MSIKYGQLCPIAKTAEVLGERWTILIIRELLLGTTRFSDFQRALSQLSPTLLSKRLTQLQDAGLVIRKALAGRQRTEYHLTAAGQELKPIVLGMGEWGMRWARGQMSDDELDVEMLMYDFSRRLDATQLPTGRTIVRFEFPDLDTFRDWWVVVEATGDRQLCLHEPAAAQDVCIRADLRVLAEVWAGDTAIRDARREGRLHVNGHPVLTRTVASWLRPGLLAHVRPDPRAATRW
jgi:DNA-binding HxlR family transcriptional regulator